MTRARLLGAFAVVAAATIWATLGLFAKILYAQASPSSRGGPYPKWSAQDS